MSWLRVFQSANPAHSGHSGGQEREPRVVPSEKYAARRGSVEDEMRMIPARFAHALQRYTSRPYMHCLPIFQEVMPISKTRNQLKPSQRRRWWYLTMPRSIRVKNLQNRFLAGKSKDCFSNIFLPIHRN